MTLYTYPMANVLAVMAKRPAVGRSKTRLCPPLTPQQAAELAEALLRDSLALGTSLADTALAVAVTPPAEIAYFEALAPPQTHLLPIPAADVGEALDKTLTALLAAGFSHALAFNADGPSAPSALFPLAFTLLETHDVVYGPSADGGYWLVGLKTPQPSLFYDIPWSTPEVMRNSLQRAAAAGLRTALLPEWYDVDTPEDLTRLTRELEALPPTALAHTRAFLAAHPIA